MMNSRKERRYPHRGRIVCEGRKAKADHNKNERFLPKQKRQRRRGGFTPPQHATSLYSPAKRFPDCNAKNKCQQQSRKSGGEECYSPTVVLVDPAAKEIAEKYANVRAHGEDSQCSWAFALGKQIRYEGLRRGRTGRFADPYPDARDSERCNVLCHAAKGRHRTPECESQRHNIAAIGSIGIARDRHAQQRVHQSEAKARQQAYRGIGKGKFAFDRLDQYVEDRAIE